MSMSTFQKVTLFFCLFLCVSLLLPKILLSRGKKEVGHAEVGPGRFPPMMHRQPMSDGQARVGMKKSNSKAYNPESVAKVKGGGLGGKGGGKTNLMGQIIPIYGFGILLYILYIVFKIMSKGRIVKSANRFPASKSENLKRKITDYELAQLQEKLRETEEVMERIVSNAGQNPDRIGRVAAEHEEKLLQQLKEITRVMQEGNLVEGASLGEQAEEPPYEEQWDDDPEETCPRHTGPCCQPTYDTSAPEEPESPPSTAGELDEGTRNVVQEAGLREDLHLPTDPRQHMDAERQETESAELWGKWGQSGKKNGMSCEEDDYIEKEEDTTVKPKRLSFSWEGHSNTNTTDVMEGLLLTAGSADSLIEAELGLDGVRKRSKRSRIAQ
ncbi:protein RIC-3 isoform X1 [Arapaima gigas]